MSKFDAANAARMQRMYTSPEVAEQRARTRAALAPRANEQGLEIGCGIGLLACEVASGLGPNGRMIGIDSSGDMIAAARDRAARADLGAKLDFRVGDAMRLDFATATFDFVVAVQVYLYVREIEPALAEVARVLRPGGRLVIVDTDWDSCVWLTADRARHFRVLEARIREFGQQHLPPMLPSLLQRAGLTLVNTEVHPMLNLRYEPGTFSAGLIEATPQIVTRFGIDRAEADAWADDLKSRTADGEYFFSLNRYLFLALKA